MKNLIIIGAGGFGREVAWLVERINAQKPTWNLLGFIDDKLDVQGKEINGYKVLGTTSDVKTFNDSFFVCAIGCSKTRKKVVEMISDAKFTSLIDPSVDMSDYVEIGEGTIICAHSILTVNISIGKHCIINLDCTIGHDAVLEDYVTLYPSVNVSGNTHYGECVELGTGTQVIQGKNIGKGTIVGASAAVIRDLPEECTAVGVPAKIKNFHLV